MTRAERLTRSPGGDNIRALDRLGFVPPEENSPLRSIPAAVLVLCLAWACAPSSALRDRPDRDPARDLRAVIITSSADGSAQPAHFYVPPAARRTGGKMPVPLLVSLHTWSTNYDRYDSHESALAGCRTRGWVFISPDFRGPNNRPEAAGSDLAVRDVLDAVAFARRNARVDDQRIYLLGASGGGHMALLLACRAPEVWAGVSASCPISDLAGWYRFCEEKGYVYAAMMRRCFGGPPDVPEREAEYRRRSPLFCLENARGVPIDIEAGILDGHDGRAVPVSHSFLAFQALLEANGLPDKKLGADEIAFIVREARLPSSLAVERDNEAGRKYPVLFRRDTSLVRLTITDAGHDFDPGADGQEPPALTWLEKQQRKTLRRSK